LPLIRRHYARRRLFAISFLRALHADFPLFAAFAAPSRRLLSPVYICLFSLPPATPPPRRPPFRRRRRFSPITLLPRRQLMFRHSHRLRFDFSFSLITLFDTAAVHYAATAISIDFFTDSPPLTPLRDDRHCCHYAAHYAIRHYAAIITPPFSPFSLMPYCHATPPPYAFRLSPIGDAFATPLR
jgi:hypothetical protein